MEEADIQEEQAAQETRDKAGITGPTDTTDNTPSDAEQQAALGTDANNSDGAAAVDVVSETDEAKGASIANASAQEGVDTQPTTTPTTEPTTGTDGVDTQDAQVVFCDTCGAANPSGARFCQNCATLLPFRHDTGTLTVKTILAGRYELLSRIGQGGMGAVYKAADTRFNNRPVAIKEMSRAGLPPARLQEAEEAFER